MKKLLPWYAVGLILVIIFGTIYTVAQQMQRRDANYPQIQIAEDLAVELNHGADPTTVVSGKVNFVSSLAPFVIIYDEFGKPIAGSGYLNDRLPKMPLDSLVDAVGKAYSFVTWETDNGVRVAAVTVATSKYYVLSGRSMVEVKKNQTNSLVLSVLGGLCALLVVLVLYGALEQSSSAGAKISKNR